MIRVLALVPLAGMVIFTGLLLMLWQGPNPFGIAGSMVMGGFSVIIVFFILFLGCVAIKLLKGKQP